MGQAVIVSPPDISEGDLLFDEVETRQILAFFWPQLKPSIAEMTVTNETRRFAQSILIAAIDSTYALGYVQSLFETVMNPRSGFKGLASMGKKLAKRYLRHWWKHATAKDLENPRVAEAVRVAIARNYRSVAEGVVMNVSAPRMTPFHLAGASLETQFWV
ncbi:hypothetical protein OOT46_13345 [Aquabacterium sp. A7-Y]|uniref:hypothetical protein n=1 Tax=Aquabacterium sp. A7-Y TaxID=1349605 RepID=UPI00223D9AC0|nr:hypothetical protein [Aquabacterium sp. A7-Y]MCW7538827.1 hypothetical protein [Aquabacterium sp. A7-Y]